MWKFAPPLLAISAAAWAASGCQTKTPAAETAIDGSGFEMLHPSAATRRFIISGDLDFAREVAAHNETCARLAGCRKGD